MALGILAVSLSLRADDSAVSVAMGGIQPRKEARVSMERERLTITNNKVTVDFDFLNEADADVMTEVGFPIPVYDLGPESRREEEFDDFRVWVNGHEFKYQTDTKALVDGKNYEGLLRGLGIDAATFGQFAWTNAPGSQIARLSPADKERLTRLALLDEDGRPAWAVQKIYHWTQVFPAHKTIHIRHQYTPEYGLEPVEVGRLQAELKDACIEDQLENLLKAGVKHRLEPKYGEYLYAQWVDYILTSANTWKTPIKSFELVVERPKPDYLGAYHVSFCWDGNVERLDADHFVARVPNFVPTHELRIYFLPY